MSDSTTKPKLTEREMELLSLSFTCLKDTNALQVDYKKLMEVGGFKTPASANAAWLVVKKKVLAGVSAPDKAGASNGDESSPSKATPKKRALKAKIPAKSGAEVEAEVENGIAADDEQTPTNTPKKKGGAKRKAPETSSPIKAEANEDAAMEDVAAHGEDATIDGTPAKKKRVYNRKPKDPNPPPPKPRAKKGTKAATAATAATEEDNPDDANAQLLEEAEAEAGQTSVFGEGDIKVEGPDEITEEEQQYLVQKAEEDEACGEHINGYANGDEMAV